MARGHRISIIAENCAITRIFVADRTPNSRVPVEGTTFVPYKFPYTGLAPGEWVSFRYLRQSRARRCVACQHDLIQERYFLPNVVRTEMALVAIKGQAVVGQCWTIPERANVI